MPYVNKMKRVSAQYGDTKENYNDDIRNLNAKRGPRFYDSKDIPVYARKQQVRDPYETWTYWLLKNDFQLPRGRKQ